MEGRMNPNGQLALWRRLMVAALRTGIPRESAEDLASEALKQALVAYDPARGPFGPFCRTIHGNLVKNHWRDRKPTVELDPEDDSLATGNDLLDEIADRREAEMMRAIAEKILAELDPQEAAFFLTLGQICRQSQRVVVAQVARRLGMTPQQGWDVLRRIRRRSRAHLEEYFGVSMMPAEMTKEERPTLGASVFEDSFEPATAPPPRAHRAAAPPDPFPFLAAAHATAGFERFDAALTPEQRARLAALLN
jgi:DNA-directed RNA polymerase specialized sigma24 family protein